MADFDFSTLVTDRSPADLELLRDLLSTPMEDWTEEQLAQFNQAASKGAYNYTDLNRVTQCMGYLNERLTAAGYVTGYQRIEIPHKGGGGLPEGYTELEYIESTGTQYIDTGFKPNQDTRVVVKAVVKVSNVANWLFGSRTANGSQQFSFLGASAGYFRADYANSQTPFDASLNTDQPITIDANKNTTYILELSASKTVPYSNFASNSNLHLFAICTNGVVSTGKVVIFYCKIYDGDTLVRDYVPCKSENGDVGLFDTVTNALYKNNGTGVFTEGAEIPIVELDPYLWYESDIPTVDLMAQYIANVTALRGVLTVWEDTPTVPADMTGLTQSEANDIETILGVIETLINNMAAAWFYSGDIYSGEADA